MDYHGFILSAYIVAFGVLILTALWAWCDYRATSKRLKALQETVPDA